MFLISLLHHRSSLFFFFFHCYADHRALHSFPTRRSSDLGKNVAPQNLENALKTSPLVSNALVVGDRRPYVAALRSEEHTSELQSLTNLVCRLLLEKKKKKKQKSKC